MRGEAEEASRRTLHERVVTLARLVEAMSVKVRIEGASRSGFHAALSYFAVPAYPRCAVSWNRHSPYRPPTRPLFRCLTSKTAWI